MTCLNMPKINYSFHRDRSNLTSHNNKYFKSEKNKKERARSGLYIYNSRMTIF